MGIRKNIFIGFMILLCMQVAAQSAFKRHTVQKGETVYSISKNYGVSEEEIIKYNPDVKSGLAEGAILVIPEGQKNNQTISQSGDFIWHTVAPKETIYGICKQYNCTEQVLYELNPELKEGLKMGMKIKVPNNVKSAATKQIQRDSTKYIYHIVEAKETVFSLCRVAGLTEEEFLALNPEIKISGLQIGQTIRWPKAAVKAEEDTPKDQKETKEFGLYRVMPGDDVVKISAKYNTTVDEIYKLNPELKNGVIIGRYIVVPAKKVLQQNISRAGKKESLFWNVPKMGEHPKVHLAVLLPLYLKENDSTEQQSMGGNAKIYPQSKMALQFLAGLKTAMDTLAGLGYKIELDVYDTRNDQETVRKIARNIDRSVDAIIGPLYSKNAELLASILKDHVVISPLSKALNNRDLPNLINAVSNMKSEYLGMAKWINKNASTTKVVFLNSDTPENRAAVSDINHCLFASDTTVHAFREVWVDEQYSQLKYLNDYVDERSNTALVIVDQDAAFISDLMTRMENRKDTSLFILGTSKILNINTLEYSYLNNKRFNAVEVGYTNFADTLTLQMVEKFRKRTFTEPDKFGFTGFDTGLYFAQLIAAYGKIPDDESWPKINGLNKGFSFHFSPIYGPQNNYVYLLRIKNYELRSIKL